MFKYVRMYLKPLFEDFKKTSFTYRFYYNKIYVPRCKRKFKKYIKEDKVVTLLIGLPRSGKTTFLAYLTHLANVCNYPVYSNVPVLGAKPFSKDDIGKYDMTNKNTGGLILLDEAGIVYDNRMSLSRDEKVFDEKALTWLKKLGHHKGHIYLFSQSMDIDVKWVRMSKDIYFIKRSLIRGFTSFNFNNRRKSTKQRTLNKIYVFRHTYPLNIYIH